MGFLLLDKTDRDVIFPMEDYPSTNSRNSVYREKLQVATNSTICIGHIQNNNHDVIEVEVKMTKQKFQKLLIPKIHPN